MKFLEENILEEKEKSFSKKKFKIWAKIELLYKKLQIKEQRGERIGHKCGGQKKAEKRLGWKCQEEDTVRTEHEDSKMIKWP